MILAHVLSRVLLTQANLMGQDWPTSEEEVKAAQAFMDFANKIIQSVDLESLAVRYTLVKQKLGRATYKCWRGKLSELVTISVLGWTVGKKKPSLKKAKETITKESEDANLVPELQDWVKARTLQLSADKYMDLKEAKMIAWNVWLDKLMDHIRTESCNNGIAAAAKDIVSCRTVLDL